MKLMMAILFALVAMAGDDWVTVEFNGRPVRGKLVDGDVVVEGDIILGSYDDFQLPSNGKNPPRASSIIPDARYRWPGGVVPYTIDAAVPNQQRIVDAIAGWNNNSKTIKVIARTTEANYVRFRVGSSTCNSNVGMIGGAQTINVIDSCNAGSLMHELGHAIGLWHTQSREDRNAHIVVHYENIDTLEYSQWNQQIVNGEDIGPYPYDSIMHYSISGFAKTVIYPSMDTIPAGIVVGQRAALAESDLDTVDRIYGKQPKCCTIASNPSGLQVIVDGKSLVTPAFADWPIGSTHSLSMETQDKDGFRYVFGRWSDYGKPSHTIRASADNTVYTLQFARMVPVSIGSTNPGRGRVDVTPPLVDGLTPYGTLLRLEPVAAAGFTFSTYSGLIYVNQGNGPGVNIFSVRSTGLLYNANFTALPVTTITTNPPNLPLIADGTTYVAGPRNFVWTAGDKHSIRIAETTVTLNAGASQYVFDGWSVGGAAEQVVTASENPQTITANFKASFRLLTDATIGGTVSINGGANVSGSLFAENAPVQLSAAVNRNGYVFTGWSGDASGTESTITVTIRGETNITANFAAPGIISAAGTVNGSSFLAGAVAPGEIVTLFGYQIGPVQLTTAKLNAQGLVDSTLAGTRVLFDGLAAPLIYVSGGQIGAVVPYRVAGKPSTVVQVDNGGKLTNSIVLAVTEAAPAFFTAQSSGRGPGAILNENGSYNTASNPAAQGSVVVLYGTGEGATDPGGIDGKPATVPFPKPKLAVAVTISGRPAEVLYSGAAPGLVAGLLQINVRVPVDLDGGELPVRFNVGSYQSPNTVTLFVK